jgi:hypothetical protein
MGAAFQCDLCDTLQEGAPDQSVTVNPRQGANTSLQMCSDCLMSFNDWRVRRAPDHDKPERDA